MFTNLNYNNEFFIINYTIIKIKIKILLSKINHSRVTFKQIVLNNLKIKIAFKIIKTIRAIHKVNKIFTIFFDYFFVFLITSIIKIVLQMIFKNRNNSFNEFIMISRIKTNTTQFMMKHSTTIIIIMRDFTIIKTMIKKQL